MRAILQFGFGLSACGRAQEGGRVPVLPEKRFLINLSLLHLSRYIKVALLSLAIIPLTSIHADEEGWKETPHGLGAVSDEIPESIRVTTEYINKGITPLYINRGRDLVGIHYTSWFDIMLGTDATVFRIDRGKEIDPDNTPYGPIGAWHYWAKPAMGFYRSSNAFVIRHHLLMLAEAGIDFIILDDTNMSATWDEVYKRNIAFRPYSVVLETVRTLLSAGYEVPRVVIWTNPDGGKSMWDHFYSRTEYSDVLLRSDENGEDKPFLFLTSRPATDDRTSPLLPFINENFHVQYMWGLKPRGTVDSSEWEYLSRPPQHVGMRDEKPEHISVTVGMQGNWMSIPHPARLGRRGGLTFQDQWRRAFEVRPRIVTIAWWNEWGVQRRYDPNIGNQFIDNYTREYSRDIEPMEGGHGDLYYQFLRQYVHSYKQNKPFPEHLLEKDFCFEEAQKRARENWPYLGLESKKE